MPEDLIALVRRFDSPERDQRSAAVHDAYTYICHQAQTVYPETLETIGPLVEIAVRPGSPGRADALMLLADIAGSTNSAPEDHAAARAAVHARLGDLMASVAAHPTAATVVAVAQLAWSYPRDAAVDPDILMSLMERFEEASVLLALALALQAHDVPDGAIFAFPAAFAEAQGEPEAPPAPQPGRWTSALRTLGLDRR
jgi:hypothetical protein